MDLYFHQVLTLTEAANFFFTILGDEEVEGESENESTSSVSLLNISTILISITCCYQQSTDNMLSTAASSPRLPSEVTDSFSDSGATIADNNFTSTKRKVICARGGLRRAARTRGGHAHLAVGPQATTDIPSWSDTVCAKRRFSF